MSTITTTCPAWCALHDAPKHRELDDLTDAGLVAYSVEPGTQLRTHARPIASLDGDAFAIEVEQEEFVRDGETRLGSVRVGVYSSGAEKLTGDQARALAALLVRAADDLDALQ